MANLGKNLHKHLMPKYHGRSFVTATWEKITHVLLQEETNNATVPQYHAKFWNGILELTIFQHMPLEEKITFMQVHQIAIDWPRLCFAAINQHFECALDLVLANYHFIPNTIKVGNCTLLFLAMNELKHTF